jgi:D-glycero-D-manno-heptose 1,7-bisphosphate phosphatase
MAPTLSPALFLDRDGVVNHEVGHLSLARDLHFTHGIFSLCRTAQSLGFRLVIVTNQPGIARGLYTTEQFENLMDYVRDEFAKESILLDAVYHCPFHPEHGVGEFRREHPDRKPSPGMLLRAAGDLALDLPRSILIGDRCSDIAAAHAASLRHAFLLAGTDWDGTEPTPCPDPHTLIHHLSEAESWLQQNP